MRYSITYFPNKDMAAINVDRPLHETFYLDHSFTPPEPVPDDVVQFVAAVREVSGVEQFIVHRRYQATLTKGSVFSWDEVLPPVLELMRGHLDPTSELIQVDAVADVSPSDSQEEEHC